jgi:hypothetical protein
MSRLRIVLGAACVLGAGLTGTLYAQTPSSYVTQLQGYLGQYAGQFLNAGYSVLGPFQSGGLNAGAATEHTANLTGGVRYGIVGVCDNDCSDVDLTLYSPTGTTVASDVALDDHPTLNFVAPMSGTYRLRVSMATCRQNPCYYGVQLYGGVAAPAPSPQPMPIAGGGGNMAPNPIGMIAVNQQVTGTLSVADLRFDNKPIQAWALNCNAGQAFQMDILSTWDNYAVVFDPLGQVAARDDDTGEGLNARVQYTCPTSGTYRLGVTTFLSSTTPGPYTLQVQAVGGATPMPQPMPQPMPAPMPAPIAQPMNMGAAAPGQMATLMMGQTINGRLEPGDRLMTDSTWADIVQFQGVAGQQVTIELRSAEFDTYLQLLDVGGARLAEDDDSLGDLDSRIIYRLPSSGMFQLVVNNFGDTRRAGSYTLTLR